MRDLLKPFRASSVGVRDIDKIKAQLAPIEAAIATGKAALNSTALTAALSGDTGAGLDQLAELEALSAKETFLKHALAGAEEQERQREAADAEKRERSRLRSIAQHLAAAERTAPDIERYTALLAASFNEFDTACSGAVALMAARGRFDFEYIASARLRRTLLDLAIAQAGEGTAAACNPHPDVWVAHEDRRTGQAPPMSALVAHWIQQIKNRLDETDPNRTASALPPVQA